MIGKVLEDLDVLRENVYNMDETGVMLCMLDSVKVLVGKDDLRNYRGAGVKRTMITAVECISCDVGIAPSHNLASNDPSEQLDDLPNSWMAFCILRIWIRRL